MNRRHLSLIDLTLLLTLSGAGVGAPAVPAVVSHLQVHIATGANELTAGSSVELRIYEAGRDVRRLALTHGESWPRDTVRIIPLTLSEGLDPRAVSRFSLYYRGAGSSSPPLEVVAAEVDLDGGQSPPQRLLNATLTGIIQPRAELATEERDAGSMRCAADADCDDHLNCNGHERCAPRSRDADSRGCVKGLPLVCPVNQVCTEDRGCRGPEVAVTPAAGPATE